MLEADFAGWRERGSDAVSVAAVDSDIADLGQMEGPPYQGSRTKGLHPNLRRAA